MKFISTNFQDAYIDQFNAASDTLHYTQDNEFRWFGIYYEGGTYADRLARITSTGELAFRVENAAIIDPSSNSSKARIQLGVEFPGDRLTCVKRMRIMPYMLPFADYDGPGAWFSIEEIFIGYPWAGDEYPARVSINLMPYQGQLHIVANGSYMSPEHNGEWNWTLWPATFDPDTPVPIGPWFDLYTGFEMNYGGNGQFTMAIRESGSWKTFIDITGPMHNPNSPDRVVHTRYDACKLYTSGHVVSYMQSHNSPCGLVWDNLDIRV